MIRRTLLLIAAAAVYIAVTRKRRRDATRETDHEAEAQWANEGGANAPASV